MLYLGEQGDNRALLMPSDNDAWVRYNAFSLDSANFTSSEATALYNNTSRQVLSWGRWSMKIVPDDGWIVR